MAHTRKRYLEEKIKKCMTFSPLVGVLGHRQVGKTTLLEKLSNHYYVLDQKAAYQEASSDPAQYLKKRAGHWVALDECQNVPEIFPELKEWVRTHKKPGQFLLSGSIRFTSREAIRESLTGRIVNLELLPFTLSELAEAPLSSFCYDLIDSDHVRAGLNQTLKTAQLIKQLKKVHSSIVQYFTRGGLPGICFIRDQQLREQKINEYLNTMLDRDLRLVKKITLPLMDIKATVAALAQYQGMPIDYTRIKKITGISTPTIKKIIYALEAIFIIRLVPIQGSTKGFTYFFEDMAEHRSLLDQTPSPLDCLTHFCFTQIRTQFIYRLGEDTKLFQYQTRGGAKIPLAFMNKKGVLGILPIRSTDDLSSISGSIDSFLKSYSKSKIIVVHMDHQKPAVVIQDRILLAPVGQVI
jgi:predicted AAA+ superfamily ATPase